MLVGQRVASGLGLDVYTQNASECANQLIKRGIDKEKMSLYEIVEYLRDLSRTQQRNSELACYEETDGVSLYEVYLHLKCRDEELYGSSSKVTPAMRSKVLQRIRGAKLIIPSEISVIKECVKEER